MFEILGKIYDIETIASGVGVHSRTQLRKKYGGRRWRKLKGVAKIRLHNGNVRYVEVHWYEAHGIGKKDFKIKRYLD